MATKNYVDVEAGHVSVATYNVHEYPYSCAEYNRETGLYESFSRRVHVGDYDDWQIRPIVEDILGVAAATLPWYDE